MNSTASRPTLTLAATSAAVALLLTLASASAGPNLLINGSFEEGDFTGNAGTSYNNITAGGTKVTGWVGRENGFDWHQAVEFGPAFEGFRMVDLTAGAALGGIEQTFATVIGEQYSLTFALSGPLQGFQNPRQVFVNVAGIATSFSTPASSAFPLNWQVQTLTFTAVDTSTTLSFRGNGTNEYWGPVIDDVSVVTVPAPASCAMLLALAGTANRRRR